MLILVELDDVVRSGPFPVSNNWDGSPRVSVFNFLWKCGKEATIEPTQDAFA